MSATYSNDPYEYALREAESSRRDDYWAGRSMPCKPSPVASTPSELWPDIAKVFGIREHGEEARDAA